MTDNSSSIFDFLNQNQTGQQMDNSGGMDNLMKLLGGQQQMPQQQATPLSSIQSQLGNNPLGLLGSTIPAFNYSQNLGKYTAQQGNILDAITNQNNPLYQQLYNQKKQQGQQNLGDAIQQLQAQNRLLTSMGRSPLLDNERGSESVFRNLMQGYQNTQNQAANDTRTTLSNAYNQANQQGVREQQNALVGAQGKSQVGGILGSLLGNSSGLLKGVFGL